MAKTKLKSVFTREDVYTVLQLLKALADGVDTNEELTDADIEKLKASVDKLNSAVSIAEDNTTTIANGIVIKPTGNVDIGKNLDVDGLIRLNTPDDLTFVTGSLPTPKTYYQHTVTMSITHGLPASGVSYITFSALSTKRTPVTTYDLLHTVFGGITIACSGVALQQTGYEYYEAGNAVLLDLRGGTISTDKVTLIYPAGSTGTNPNAVALSALGSIVFKDDVTPL